MENRGKGMIPIKNEMVDTESISCYCGRQTHRGLEHYTLTSLVCDYCHLEYHVSDTTLKHLKGKRLWQWQNFPDYLRVLKEIGALQ